MQMNQNLIFEISKIQNIGPLPCCQSIFLLELDRNKSELVIMSKVVAIGTLTVNFKCKA